MVPVQFLTGRLQYESTARCTTKIAVNVLTLLAAITALHFSGSASDWPQFLGPTRDGTYPGSDLSEEWPKDGPPVQWQKNVGQGFSGPVVKSGSLVMFHRLDNKEIIDCLEAQTGKAIWTFNYPTSYRDDFGFDEGPRATPAIDDNRIYTYGAEGLLHCINASSGKKIWSVNARTDFHPPKGFFGIACSPLVEGNLVFIIVGSRDGAGIVAFDKMNGKVVWKTSDEEASYSSPVIATLGGRRCGLFLTRSSLVGLEPEQGKPLFKFPFRPPMNSSVTAAVPLAIGDRIFLSASYGTGATLLQLNGTSLNKVWESEDALSAHYATPVHHHGFLYGIHGRVDPGFEPPASLRCVEIASGKLMWEQKPFPGATLTLAGDALIILTERGELVRAAASSAGFKKTGQAQILPTQVRAHPALANGLFYARSKDKLICVDLSKKKN